MNNARSNNGKTLIITDPAPVTEPEVVEEGINIGRHLVTGTLMILLLTVITGIIYPVLVTGVAQVAFSSQANGSLARDEGGRVVGSELLGQVFTDTTYFHGRPSAGGTFSGNGFDWATDDVPSVSGGSNLGPTNAKLVLTTTVEAANGLRETEGMAANAPVPVDMATTSASGLDPHITPASAIIQIPRVATARNLPQDQVRRLVDQYTEGRDLFFLGEPRVNVLRLNLALDALR